MAAPVLLVHSPLLGPRAWHPVAEELRGLGHRVSVPSLVAGATAGRWEACVALAVADAPAGERLVVVGHSGAGPLLPAIGAALPTPPARLVFVDAGLPPTDGPPR